MLRWLGQRGERRAERYLRRQGLKPAERNYNCRHGEIDLVMEDDVALVFVEVRVRRTGGFGDAADSVDRHKQQRLIRAARHYLMTHPEWADRPCRFDVIALKRDHDALDWIPNAFEVQA